MGDETETMARERRLQGLIARLPLRVQRSIVWLRERHRWWVRIPAGLLLIVGGCLAILPFLGLWMLPLGIVLLADDLPPLNRLTGRWLAWIEQHRPHWIVQH